MITHYKCPNCGADMEFDAASGNLKCHSCGRKDNIEKMAGIDKTPKNAEVSYNMDDDDKKAEQNSFEKEFSDPFFEDSPSHHHTFSNNEIAEYHCNNCGAVLIADPQTAATRCSFCGAGIVLSDRLSGIYSPEYVIPFSITKEQAQAAFIKWCKKGLLTPKDFKAADRIKDITGLYVPFWLYDMNGKGEAVATCTKVRTYTRGDWIYTETRYYHVYRKVDLDFLKVPCDASKKMDDSMMDKLEPFPYSNLKDFKMPYLAGFIAEKYDYDDEQLLPRIKNRIHSYVESYLRSTISGYTTVHFNKLDIYVRKKKSDYALLPVWILCYDYKQAEHNFVMNGQTGKIVGKPPISKGKVAAWFFGVSGGCFILLRLLTLILGGGLI